MTRPRIRGRVSTPADPEINAVEAEPIRSALRKQPFSPFTITTSAGEKLAITHPETILQTEGGNTVVVRTGQEGFAILDVKNITSVQFGKGRKAPRGQAD